MWLTGPAAPWHVGSSQTRARTRVPCISRQILNHCATREALLSSFEGCWTLLWKAGKLLVDVFDLFETFKNSLFQNNYGFTGNFKDSTERAHEPFTVFPMSASSITIVQYQTQEIYVDKICMYNSVPFYHMYRFMYSRPPLPWFYFPGFQLPTVNLSPKILNGKFQK